MDIQLSALGASMINTPSASAGPWDWERAFEAPAAFAGTAAFVSSVVAALRTLIAGTRITNAQAASA